MNYEYELDLGAIGFFPADIHFDYESAGYYKGEIEIKHVFVEIKGKTVDVASELNQFTQEDITEHLRECLRDDGKDA